MFACMSTGQSYRPGNSTCVSSDSTTDIADAIGLLTANDAIFIVLQYPDVYFIAGKRNISTTPHKNHLKV